MCMYEVYYGLLLPKLGKFFSKRKSPKAEKQINPHSVPTIGNRMGVNLLFNNLF